MITYPIFLEFVKENILSYMPEEYSTCQIENIRAIKENGQVFEGFAIVTDGKGYCCAPAFYCESFYKMFQETQNIDEVMHYIAAQYVYWDNEGKKFNFPDLKNFEEVKDLIGYSVVNERFSQEMLKGVLHKSTEDLAKVYRVFMMDDDGCKSVKITNEILDVWEISESELDTIADRNMPNLFPPVVESVEHMMNYMLDIESIESKEGEGFSLGRDMYVLSNRQLSGGASVIFYPGLLESIRESANEDFYILPSSTEEVIIVSKNLHSAKWLGELVRAGNRDVTAQNEVLSDCIYEYTKESGKIRKVPESVPQVEKKRGMER